MSMNNHLNGGLRDRSEEEKVIFALTKISQHHPEYSDVELESLGIKVLRPLGGNDRLDGWTGEYIEEGAVNE